MSANPACHLPGGLTDSREQLNTSLRLYRGIDLALMFKCVTLPIRNTDLSHATQDCRAVAINKNKISDRPFRQTAPPKGSKRVRQREFNSASGHARNCSNTL